ncbi:MAG: glycosyltransferase family 4 protein [Coriobacteriia bacterium]|nr:glycosyltransferase family 4 protein [Coriobacteriia bacterium]
MRIGFFTDTYTPQINGVVTSIQLFKDALERRGHEVYVFAPTPEHEADGVRVIRFPSLPFVFQPEMRLATPISIEALRILDAVDLDVVHSHDPFAIGLYGLNVARRAKIPYVHTYHTLYPEYVHYVWETRLTRKLAERLSRDFCQMCTSIIAPSTKIELHLRDWGVRVPIDVIATGVDTRRFAAPTPEALTRMEARIRPRPGDRVLLFMGRLGREKNVELLLRALWHTRNARIRLVIAGDGPYRGELDSIVEELDLGDRVTFVGYLDREDVVAAYHLADGFAFASTSETQGLVIGEAMAACLPIVAVEDRAVEDFVIDGRTGLITPGRAEDLGHAFDALLADDERRVRFAHAACERAGHFSIEHQAERLEHHYERAINDYRPRRRLALPLRRKSAGGDAVSPRT